MAKQTEFCLPTSGKAVPSGDEWIHEVKYDGYRLRVVRSGKNVRLFSKGGTDWTKRYPWIVETALKIRQDRFVIDGEAVILGVDGISDFNALHSRQEDHEVQLYATPLPILSQSQPHDGTYTRKGYIAVFEIADVVFDQDGLRYI